MADDIKKEQASPRSFRVTDEVMEKIKQIQSDFGLTQDAALRHLIETYEFQQAKEQIPSREKEIDNFQRKAQDLMDAFLFSLQLNEDAEDRIRVEFGQKLQLQDQAILDYQEKIKELKAANSALTMDAANAVMLQQELDEAKDAARQTKAELEERIAEQKLTIRGLQNDNAMLQIQADGYPDLKNERDSLIGQLRDTKQEIKDLKKDHKAEMERAAREAEKAQDAAVAAVRAEGEAKAEALKEQLQQAQVAGAQALQAAEKAAHEADKEAAEEIRRLEKTIADLREQLARRTNVEDKN